MRAKVRIDDIHGVEAPAHADLEYPGIAFRWWKTHSAASVPNSKNVSGVSRRAASTRSKAAISSSSVAARPPTRTRSL